MQHCNAGERTISLSTTRDRAHEPLLSVAQCSADTTTESPLSAKPTHQQPHFHFLPSSLLTLRHFNFNAKHGLYRPPPVPFKPPHLRRRAQRNHHHRHRHLHRLRRQEVDLRHAFPPPRVPLWRPPRRRPRRPVDFHHRRS